MRPIAENERLAIAIPTRNRHAHLAVTIGGLLQQSYPNWMLVINDSSDVPIESSDLLSVLFALVRRAGHDLRIIYTDTGSDRHQAAMEAVPRGIEFIVRMDDDLLPSPSYVENVIRPFLVFRDRPLAATGGCYPEAHQRALHIEPCLRDPRWACDLHAPQWPHHGWRLQGHCYHERQILEVGSLLGHAICYRRSAVRKVGGWAVDGYSRQAHREESDLCARLSAAGFEMMVTTGALAWHLYAPEGGSREVLKLGDRKVLLSDLAPVRSDEALFWRRLSQLGGGVRSRPNWKRYDLAGRPVRAPQRGTR